VTLANRFTVFAWVLGVLLILGLALTLGVALEFGGLGGHSESGSDVSPVVTVHTGG
jgi:hypothetical protein